MKAANSKMQRGWLRMTISRKISLAVVAIVVLCVGAMAAITSSNLKRGFLNYLDDLQLREIAPVRDVIAERYKTEGNFDWLRRNRLEMKKIFDSVRGNPGKSGAAGASPGDGAGPDMRDGAPPQLADGPPGPPPAQPVSGPGMGKRVTILDEQGQKVIGPDPMPGAGSMPLMANGKQVGTFYLADADVMQLREAAPLRDAIMARFQSEGNFEWLRHNRAEMRKIMESVRAAPRGWPGPGQAGPDNWGGMPPHAPGRDGPPPQLAHSGAPPDPPPHELPPPGAEGPRGDGKQRRGPLPGQTAHDPLGYGGRLSIVDAEGRKVIGPDPIPGSGSMPIVVEGKQVGTIFLARLDQIGAAADPSSALNFVRGQMRDTIWLALALALLAILLALALARHFLRPIMALRQVTEKISRGEFDARAPLLGSDELAQLAQHVNQMAETLGQAEQQRRQMMADIAHELRTPLTVVRGEIEALLDGIRKLDKKAMESLHTEVLRLNKMVDDIHQLTLADVGDLHFQFEETDLIEMLEPVLLRYQLRANKAGLELHWQLPPLHAPLKADSGRLTQVITNLLENSVRYTDAPGRIVLQVEIGEAWANITIDDSAPGVPAGAHERLFERLFRVDRARSRARGGSGLGLSICQALVQAHGGKIQAGPSPLQGVRMSIHLPLCAPPCPRAAQEAGQGLMLETVELKVVGGRAVYPPQMVEQARERERLEQAQALEAQSQKQPEDSAGQPRARAVGNGDTGPGPL
ncbi:ATP-binding protein [Massilia sp. W12]|uniref:ATP-binding protein n=1 Tax=Massilia sp. W12 TaxID=3126507 RepID=UPI0030D14C07